MENHRGLHKGGTVSAVAKIDTANRGISIPARETGALLSLNFAINDKLQQCRKKVYKFPAVHGTIALCKAFQVR